MALGIIADVRGGGILASAPWLSRRPWSQARRMRAGEGYSVGGSEAGRLGSSSYRLREKVAENSPVDTRGWGWTTFLSSRG